MNWRRIAVLLGSLVLGVTVGGIISDTANSGIYGPGAGVGLGLVLVAFVRD